MSLYARVNQGDPNKVITACGGITFTKSAWVQVPAGEEKSAKANPHLETVDKLPKQTAAMQMVVPAPRRAITNNEKTVRLINRKSGQAVEAPITEEAQNASDAAA